MKTNKLLILALPLLLAISACSNSGSQSNQSSQDTSSEEPAPSRSEEPLPEVDPVERETEAKNAFANISNVLATGDYMIMGEGSDTGYHTPFIVVADGYYLTSVSPQLDDGSSYRTLTVGYLANAHGVLRIRSWGAGDFGSPVGYAFKTDTYEEARQFVNSQQVRFELDSDKWEYVQNEVGNANFKTTDEETLNAISQCFYGTEVSNKFSVAYAVVAPSGESVTISTDTTMSGRPNYFTVTQLHLNKYRGVTRESDSGNWRERQIAENIAYWKNYEVSDSEWETYSNWYNFRYELPFPTDGNRYYFLDWFTENSDVFANDRYTHIGFVDTGDITSSFKTQLLNNGWELDAGETNKLSRGQYHVTLRFVESSACDRPDVYTKGIWYIDYSCVY